MRIINQGNLSAERIAEIESAIHEQQNLKDMMDWALSNPENFTPNVVSEVVIQDEFTHDVIVPWGKDVVLVYDTT